MTTACGDCSVSALHPSLLRQEPVDATIPSRYWDSHVRARGWHETIVIAAKAKRGIGGKGAENAVGRFRG